MLCDTNGGTLPAEVTAIVTAATKVVPGDHLGIHAHDDTGHAVANSLAAVLAGARQIQGTLNGIGERCGNANLVSLIPTLKLKPAFAALVDIGIDDAALATLTHVSRAFDELLNRAPNRHAPYVGASAFATKAGIHASALVKDPKTYEHVPPRDRRQPPPRPRLRPGRQVEPDRRAGPARARGRPRRPPPRRPARRGQGARGARLRLRGRRRLCSNSSPAARSAACRTISPCRVSASWSSAATTRWANW